MARPERRSAAASLGGGMTLVAGLVLAVSSFTGWYTGVAANEGVRVSVTGWDTGVLGKLVLILGLAAIVVVSLSRVGLEPPGGVPESLITIGLGALATIFCLIRVVSIPDDFYFAGRGVGIWIALASAAGVLAAGLLRASDDL